VCERLIGKAELTAVFPVRPSPIRLGVHLVARQGLRRGGGHGAGACSACGAAPVAEPGANCWAVTGNSTPLLAARGRHW